MLLTEMLYFTAKRILIFYRNVIMPKLEQTANVKDLAPVWHSAHSQRALKYTSASAPLVVWSSLVYTLCQKYV
jgi:hypothetical protein